MKQYLLFMSQNRRWLRFEGGMQFTNNRHYAKLNCIIDFKKNRVR